MGQGDRGISSRRLIQFTTPKQLSELAGCLSERAGLMDRFLMKYRPRLCPFHVMMEFVQKGSRVLDIGCGNGLWLYLLSRLDRIESGVGLELSAEKVSTAESIKSDKDRLEFLHIGTEDDWPSGEFDCLSMIDVLHHVPKDKQKAFIGRISKTGAGRLIFKDIDPAAKFKSFMNSVHDILLSRQVPRYCCREDVSEWIEEAGFRVVHSNRCDMLWYSHYLIVAEKK